MRVIKLILMHQVPQGLKYPADFQAVISPDNRGNGKWQRRFFRRTFPTRASVGIVDFGLISHDQ